MQALPNASATRSATADTRPGASLVVAPTSPVGAQPRGDSLCCGCGGNHTASYRGCVRWKEAKVALVKRAPVSVGKSAARSHSAAPKAQRAGPSAEQWDLGEGWNRVARGGRVFKATPIPNPSPQTVTEAPPQPKVTATSKTAGSQKPKPKSTAATKLAAGKSKKKVASVKTAAAKPTTPELVVPTQSATSPLEEISDLLDHLPIPACVELTRRLLTSFSSHHTGAARPRAVLKTVILFMAEYGSTP